MMNIYRSISSSIALAFGIFLISAGETGGSTVAAIPTESSVISELTDTVGNDPKADSGTHEELISRKGPYFDLIRNQLELGN